MARKIPAKPAVGTRLEDVLAQKHVLVTSSSDKAASRIRELEARVTDLTAENRRLMEELAKSAVTIPGIPDPSSLFREAVERMKSGLFVSAAGYLQTVLILEPGHIGARLNLAVVHHELGETRKAVDMLTSVLRDDPDNTIARDNLNLLTGIQGMNHT